MSLDSIIWIRINEVFQSVLHTYIIIEVIRHLSSRSPRTVRSHNLIVLLMTRTFHLASSAPHWRKVGNKTALEPFGLVFLIGLSILLGFEPMDAKSRLLTDPIDTYRYRTIGED